MNRIERAKEQAEKNKKSIEKLDSHGNVICVYSSMKEAAKHIKRTPVAITEAVKNNYKSAGFYWKLEKDKFNIIKEIYEKT